MRVSVISPLSLIVLLIAWGVLLPPVGGDAPSAMTPPRLDTPMVFFNVSRVAPAANLASGLRTVSVTFKDYISPASISDAYLHRSCSRLRYDDSNIEFCQSAMSISARNKVIDKLYQRHAAHFDQDATAHEAFTDALLLLKDAATVGAGNALYYTYAYSQRENGTFAKDLPYSDTSISVSDRRKTMQRVCVVGSFQAHIADLILSLNPRYLVFFFPGKESSSEKILYENYKELFSGSDNVFLISDVDLLSFSLTHRAMGKGPFCDVLHVSVDVSGLLSKRDVDILGDIALDPPLQSGEDEIDYEDGRLNAGKLPYQIVWERTLTAPLHPTESHSPAIYGDDTLNSHSRIEWIVSGFYNSNSDMSFQRDRNGYMSAAVKRVSDGSALVCISFGNLMPASAAIQLSGYMHINPHIYSRGHMEVFITFTNRAYSEIARGLWRALLTSGYTHAHIMGDFNSTLYREIVGPPRKQLKRRVIQIVIGAHEPQLLTENYIVVDLYPSAHMMSPALYEAVLGGAIAIWVHSEHLGTSLEKNNSNIADKISYVPIYHEAIYDVSSLTSRSRSHRYDLLLSGECSEKREKFVEKMRQLAANDGLIVYDTCAHSEEEVLFGEERDMMILASKVVIHMHSAASSADILPLFALMSLGSAIVSEPVVLDSKFAQLFKESMLFGAFPEDLYEKARFLVRNAVVRRVLRQQAVAAYTAMKEDTTQLHLAMDIVGEQLLSKRKYIAK